MPTEGERERQILLTCIFLHVGIGHVFEELIQKIFEFNSQMAANISGRGKNGRIMAGGLSSCNKASINSAV